MKKLVTRYIRLHKEVAFFEKLAVFLLIALGAYVLYSIYSVGPGKSLNQIETFGVVLSVILVSKIASRQITHSELVVENERANSLAENTHFLMTIINEMKNKTHFIQTTLLENSQASAPEVETLITFINDVKVGYQALKDKGSHKHLKGTTLVLIWNMSINIENLMQLAKLLVEPEKFNLTPLAPNAILTILRGNESHSSSLAIPVATAVDDILVALKQIDKEVRELRDTINLPAKLIEEYEKT